MCWQARVAPTVQSQLPASGHALPLAQHEGLGDATALNSIFLKPGGLQHSLILSPDSQVEKHLHVRWHVNIARSEEQTVASVENTGDCSMGLSWEHCM